MTLGLVVGSPSGAVHEAAVASVPWHMRPGNLDPLAKLRPLVGIALAIAYADDGIDGAEVGMIREHFQRAANLDAAGLAELKELTRLGPPADLKKLVEAHAMQHPEATVPLMLSAMLAVASADARVHPAEVQVIREVCDVVNAELFELIRPAIESTDQKLQSEDPWAVLGLERGCTVEEARHKYLELTKQYHPDRYASAPPDLRELATRRTRELRAAWEAVRSAAGSKSEEDRQRIPRPTVPAPASRFGVEPHELTWKPLPFVQDRASDTGISAETVAVGALGLLLGALFGGC